MKEDKRKRTKYDWVEIQKDYDDGLSYCRLMDKYGMAPASLRKARDRGVFIPRTKSEAKFNDIKINGTYKHTEDHKRKMSEKIKKRYDDGWLPKAGRCKKYWYESKIAGKVSLDGTWELSTAIYLDYICIDWRRNTKRFKYKNLLGSESYYTPDFYIIDHDTFIEVKGYETDLDRCKWSQFPDKIVIWKKDEIKIIQEMVGWSNGQDASLLN